jgi:hypothetical protein
MFDMTDVMKEIYDEFPGVDKHSLDKICKDGIVGLLKLMRRKEEVIIKLGTNKEVKFCVPSSPEKQRRLTFRNIGRRKRAALRKQNGEKSK